MQLCVRMDFKVSHIFREENNCADKLANLSVDNKLDFFWYSIMPPCLSLDFFHNKYQFPLFHI